MKAKLSPIPSIDTFRDDSKRKQSYRWHFRRGQRIVAQGEGHASPSHARRAAYAAVVTGYIAMAKLAAAGDKQALRALDRILLKQPKR